MIDGVGPLGVGVTDGVGPLGVGVIDGVGPLGVGVTEGVCWLGVLVTEGVVELTPVDGGVVCGWTLVEPAEDLFKKKNHNS